MISARFFTVLILCFLFPLSSAAQSVSPVPVPQPMTIPQPAIHVPVSPSLEIHPQPVIPMIFGDSDRDLPVQEQETIQKSFSMSGIEHKSLEVDNVWGSIE